MASTRRFMKKAVWASWEGFRGEEEGGKTSTAPEATEALPPLPDGEDDDLDIDMGEGPGGAVE
ncbi:hypothetical protein PENSTE_c006G04333 [Penicillium steckii]|uniref:Uncharacterized protein n=1 Tax=Penicillium steckii TaxID=303698 RepID=A0A1V6TGT1_9EURO|nr:hypothetical protein PENSTE_c006G04333 [Penicillium steckii]